MSLKVMKNEVDGWDVVREDEGLALSNHPTREEAIAAAEIRSDEERVNDVGDTPVDVTKEVHEIDDARTGVKPAFLGGGALLLGIILLIVVVSVIVAVTNLGS
jgi:hypothetical protein